MTKPELVARPVASRIMAYVSGACMVAISAAITIALPADIRAVFTPFQVGTLLACLGAVLFVLWGVARSKVVVDDSGLTVVNGYRRYEVPWTEVRGVSFRNGAPWPTLVRLDDSKVILFAIQATDGDQAKRVVKQIRGHLG
ncbi:MAG: hypothetical protein JWP10_523 [Nocardioidaceae bacterium]|nr:hypothetical protein [Nocardioidaceae bacterium]